MSAAQPHMQQTGLRSRVRAAELIRLAAIDYLEKFSMTNKYLNETRPTWLTTRRFIVWISFTAILLPLFIFSYTSATNSSDSSFTSTLGTPSSENVVTPLLTSTVEPSSEKEVVDYDLIQIQLELIQLFDQRLLSTVYWSLGAIVTLAVLVAGFSWFSNFRLYERDKDALRLEIQRTIVHIQSDIEHNMTSKSNKLGENLKVFLSSEISGEVSVLRTKLDRISTKYQTLNISAQVQEAKIWELKGVHNNALSCFRSALDIAIDGDQSQYYSSILSGIMSATEQVDGISNFIVTDFAETFSQLPTKHEPSWKKIMALMEEKLY